MLEKFFEATFTINRLRAGPSGQYIDGYAGKLEREGYSWETARRYLRAASHLGRFVELKGIGLDTVNWKWLRAFESHLPSCHCPESNGGTTKDVAQGARLFLDYLRDIEILQTAELEERKTPEPELVNSFKYWLKEHRGLSESAQYHYGRGARDLIRSLGNDPGKYDAQSLRSFLLDRASKIGPGAAKSLVTALRMFLRYLGHQGLCQAGLEYAIPALAGWRHATLPKYLPASDVQRIIDACDGSSLMDIRDRAISFLLVRLGLRAGDVVKLQFSDIDWDDGSLLLLGKGRFEARLPLPQDVGDAILHYIQNRPPVDADEIFLRICAPFRPFSSGRAITTIVTRRMLKANVVTASGGAHILRHTAATEMMRKGVPLYEIGSVLRHRSLDMAAYYAKVDIDLLRQVAQPWPEVLSMMMKAIDSYLSVRRAAGYELEVPEYLLRSFGRFASARGEKCVCSQTVIEWASQAPSLGQRDHRLNTVRRFACHVQVEDPRHEIPPKRVFGYSKKRRVPFIFTSDNVNSLLLEATQLDPPGSLRPHTYTTLFALLVTTGLRISEALALEFEDISPDGLIIRRTKFQKSRLVPLHETAQVGLEKYVARRKRFASCDNHVFISLRGRVLHRSAVQWTFRSILKSIGLDPAPDGRRPRIHDLRHSYACKALETCPDGRENISRHIRALSTYMGHVKISDTYWYLESTPYLMQLIADACESFSKGGAS